MNWRRSVSAMVRKEFLTELRAPHALLTGGLVSFLGVVALNVATYNIRLTPTLGAGLLWVVLLFAGVASLPRTFIGEEEAGTADILRLTSDPYTVYWGKAIFNGILALVTALVVGGLFVVVDELPIVSIGMFLTGLCGGALALSGAVTLCGALAARASSRQSLAGALALSLTIPIATWGVESMRVAMGDGLPQVGRAAALGLVAYAVLSNGVGPYIYAALWKS